MRFFCCLIFLSCIFLKYSFAIDDKNYILCTSKCSDIILSFSQPTTFPADCQKDDSSTNIYEHALACIVTYYVNYKSNEITIQFQATNDTTEFEGHKPSEYLKQQLNLGLKHDPSEQTEIQRTYGCNTKNDCGRDFYLATITHFVNEIKPQLMLIKHKLHNDSLKLSPESERRCSKSNLAPNKIAPRCRFGLCYANYENYTSNPERHNKTQRCDLNTDPFLTSYTEYHQPKSLEKDREHLEYRCSKNICNRDSMISIIRGIFHNATKWEFVATKSTNSSMKQVLASYIVVLFTILIQLFI